ncbi:MAG: serine O-acetyltransferase EpsC [Planctomycetia bacterium]|nr:serine O-acetyltransferase EpsC [Planctomycetia bacterium]
MNPISLKIKEDNLPDITWNLVQSCNVLGNIQNLGHCSLPTYRIVVEILEELFEVIYPGFGQRKNLHFGNLPYFMGEILDRVYDKLASQITQSFCHSHSGKCQESESSSKNDCDSSVRAEFERCAQEKTLAFLARLPELRKLLETDVVAAYAGDPACKSYAEAIFCYPGLKAITTYRIAHELHLLEVPLIPRMMTEWAHNCTGIDIHPGASIGPHFFIDHGTGVVIGETCEIGEWVKLYQGVTLGALSFPTDERGELVRGQKRHPTIKDHVVIYANATVLGGTTIVGEHAVVGASTWVVESIAPHTTVLIEKPKLRIR